MLFSTNAVLLNISNSLYGLAEFECGKSQRLVRGNLKRYCTMNGWSGKPAFCECKLRFSWDKLLMNFILTSFFYYDYHIIRYFICFIFILLSKLLTWRPKILK